jgi:hypothetical protein
MTPPCPAFLGTSGNEIFDAICCKAVSDSRLENAAPSLEDRCQILRQKIGNLEGGIFRSGNLTFHIPVSGIILILHRKDRCLTPVSQGNSKSRILRRDARGFHELVIES